MRFGAVAQPNKSDTVIDLGIIILARYNSSRLPGKALLNIDGKPVLQYILERVEQVVPKNQICVATSAEATDDEIAKFAENYGVRVHRGSLHHVAERFYEAATNMRCKYACRINGDNIFLDTSTLQEMLTAVRSNKYQFLSNVKNRTFPKGMSIEIAELDYYEKHLPTILASSYYTEHVMVYLYERAEDDNHYYLMNTKVPEAAGLQLAMDTIEDFRRAEWIIDNFTKPQEQVGMKEITELAIAYEQQTER